MHLPENDLVRKLEKAFYFDLCKLNATGWTLLIVSTALYLVLPVIWVVLEITEVVPVNWTVRRFAIPPLVLIPFGFFFGCRWLLRRVGVSLYKSNTDTNNISEKKGK
jgi:hypothetical protein